jgi:lipopolysaccharide export system protein LptA
VVPDDRDDHRQCACSAQRARRESRARAAEIDWNTKIQKSFFRGKVSTTYYSQKQTNGAVPFGKSNAPVFVTSNDAEFDHQSQVSIYLGNARAWQDNNYVRAEKLIFQEKSQRMDGEGKVQSLLYSTQKKVGEKEVSKPVYATSDKIAYTGENRVLHYEGNVDIRQETDRVVGGIADIYLNENNEAKQTIVQNNVVITQPNRRATGNWAQHTSVDEVVVMRGNPVTVVDGESGTSQGSQMTFSMRDNKLLNQGTTKPNAAGRTRSVYKVKP